MDCPQHLPLAPHQHLLPTRMFIDLPSQIGHRINRVSKGPLYAAHCTADKRADLLAIPARKVFLHRRVPPDHCRLPRKPRHHPVAGPLHTRNYSQYKYQHVAHHPQHHRSVLVPAHPLQRRKRLHRLPRSRKDLREQNAKNYRSQRDHCSPPEKRSSPRFPASVAAARRL